MFRWQVPHSDAHHLATNTIIIFFFLYGPACVDLDTWG